MLPLTQKIDTEADAEDALQKSYQLMAPLGVPTLIIDPADYDPRLSVWRMPFEGTIEDRLMRKLKKVIFSFYGEGDKSARAFIKSATSFRMKLLSTLEQAIKGRQMTARSLSYENLFNVVICPRTRDTGTLLLKHGLNLQENHIPGLPGSDQQWNFIKLWHEFGHGYAGAAETNADWVSGVVYQHVFADPAPLMVLSDFRAAQALLNYDKPEMLDRRGWALVDTMDRVSELQLPAAWPDHVGSIDTISQLGMMASDVQYVGGQLRKISRLAFEEPDLLMLGMMADHMAYKGNVENENQLRIAHRFAIAAQRLSMGTPAYTATIRIALGVMQ